MSVRLFLYPRLSQKSDTKSLVVVQLPPFHNSLKALQSPLTHEYFKCGFFACFKMLALQCDVHFASGAAILPAVGQSAPWLRLRQAIVLWQDQHDHEWDSNVLTDVISDWGCQKQGA